MHGRMNIKLQQNIYSCERTKLDTAQELSNFF